MGAFVLRRLLWMPVLLFFVSVITFALGLYGPGDPVQVMLGLHANPETIERLRHEYGFDQPFYAQYLNYIGNALQGNFGYSLVKYRDQPVGALIAERLPVTIQLNLIAIILGVVIGIPLGLVAGIRRDSWIDFIVRAIVIAGISFPIIFLNPVLTFIFSRRHDIVIAAMNLSFSIGPLLPMVGGHWDGIFSTKIILPAFIEATGVIAIMTRQMRAGMIEELGKDYVRTARAKGLRERMVVVRHAMRNALIPIATILGLMLGGLVAGSFLVESWFGVPGVGALAFDALSARDYYVIMATTLLIAVGYVTANLVVDISYGFLDPRIRQS
ncbi:MAG: ABC transporter permease [Chloroflexota bacterium]|nr:ABC transporter permease [Chloroflexota bacterium]